METLTTQARARVGLLGNPSDLYGGRGIGFTVEQLGARVTLVERSPASGSGLGSELVAAGWRVFRDEVLGDPTAQPRFELSVECDVPFQSGLSGSSAILVAALRAFALHRGVSLAPLRLAELALLAESRELGLLAGPLDRLVQAFGGLVFMDFADPFRPDRSSPVTRPDPVTRLDPVALPPLLIAWSTSPGRPSGGVHEPVRRRWERGDPRVRAVMDELAALADAGLEALRAGDRGRLCDLIDRNFDLRASLFSIEPADRRMIELGRGAGAATKFCGSGGSVVAAPRDGALAPLEACYRAAGFEVLVPTIEQMPT